MEICVNVNSATRVHERCSRTKTSARQYLEICVSVNVVDLSARTSRRQIFVFFGEQQSTCPREVRTDRSTTLHFYTYCQHLLSTLFCPRAPFMGNVRRCPLLHIFPNVFGTVSFFSSLAGFSTKPHPYCSVGCKVMTLAKQVHPSAVVSPRLTVRGPEFWVGSAGPRSVCNYCYYFYYLNITINHIIVVSMVVILIRPCVFIVVSVVVSAIGIGIIIDNIIMVIVIFISSSFIVIIIIITIVINYFHDHYYYWSSYYQYYSYYRD